MANQPNALTPKQHDLVVERAKAATEIHRARLKLAELDEQLASEGLINGLRVGTQVMSW